MRKDIQYYHRLVAVVLVSTEFPVPLGVRFQRQGEDEVACALALLQELDRQLGRRFFDVLVADSLYLRSGFVQEMEKLQLEWVVTIKENQPELLAEAQRLTGGPPQTSWSTAEDEFKLWHAPETYWPAGRRSLRVVKTFRIRKKQQVALTPAGSPKKKKPRKEEVREESTNYYATNLELGSIAPTFIHQLGRSRWRVDTRRLPNPHHPGSSQAALRSSNLCAGGADHGSRSGLYPQYRVLLPSSRQSRSPNTTHLQRDGPPAGLPFPAGAHGLQLRPAANPCACAPRSARPPFSPSGQTPPFPARLELRVPSETLPRRPAKPAKQLPIINVAATLWVCEIAGGGA